MPSDAVDKGALHPRIDELLEVLDETRAALTMAVARVPASARDVRPPDGSWSVGEVLDHLHKVESGFARLLAKRVADARVRGVGPEREASSILARLGPDALPDRSRKLEAPSIVSPREGTSTQEALAALAGSRRSVRDTLIAANGLALGEIMQQHLVLGNIDMYQWTLFVARHEERHAAQIREIADGRRG